MFELKLSLTLIKFQVLKLGEFAPIKDAITTFNKFLGGFQTFRLKSHLACCVTAYLSFKFHKIASTFSLLSPHFQKPGCTQLRASQAGNPVISEELIRGFLRLAIYCGS